MKRAGRLFESIVDASNLRLAFLKAIRGKRRSADVLLFCRDVDQNLGKIERRLRCLEPDWGHYRQFIVEEPKRRTITASSLEERIMHHAIMNVLEPIFERQLIHHSYACRKGKGTHAAVQQAFHLCKGGRFFLKLDVRRYFDSVDHDILKARLARIIKDQRTLFLLGGVIDSFCTSPGKGLPIGNLTSQFFANFYLSGMDHFVLETLHPAGYVRYMDDFVSWHDDGGVLRRMHGLLEQYADRELGLTLKPPVFGSSPAGLPFLGFRIASDGISLPRKARDRIAGHARDMEKLLRCGGIGEEKAGERMRSVLAAISLARSRGFRVSLWHGGRPRAPTA